MSKKEKERFEISEMFMAKADVNRCFFGCINRLKDDNGKPYVSIRIVVNDELLCASTPEQRELGDNLDKMCLTICDKGLHNDAGISTKIFGTDFFLN